MRIKFSTIIPIVFIAAIVLNNSCKKDVIYPIIPAIQYKNFEKLKSYNGSDSALKLTISYTDGDGDLGLKQTQIDPPFDSSSIYYYNMYVYYYEYFNNKWNQVTINDFSTDTIRFKYRFPYLTPNTDNKVIKGEIDFTINNLIPIKSNRIKFSIFIYDRKLNKSNTVESDVITY